MAIVRDKFGNIVSETSKKTALQVAQDAAGIPVEEQVTAKDVNCIRKKLDDLALAAKSRANKLDEDSIDG